jgi:hypothetical protein
MQIWQFNDPEPLHPFFKVLEKHAPHLVESCHRLLSESGGATQMDLIRLAQGLVDRSETVREAVRVLIFTPPVEDELDHFRRLLRWLPFWLPPGWHKNSSLSRLVAELASCSDNLQGCPPIATIFQAALKQRFRPGRQDAAHLTALWRPKSRRCLLSLLARRLPDSMTLGLKRRLLESTHLSLGLIYEILAAANRLTPMGACRYWRKMVQLANVARPSIMGSSVCFIKTSCLESNGDVRILSWARRRPEEIAYLERLIGYQTNELVEVYNLAKEVSRRTRRVVLTLHNASLGAATGWGIPSFAQQISDDISAAFGERVNSLRRNFAAQLGYSGQSYPACSSHFLKGRVDRLFLLWGKRLIRPRLLRDLWALRVSLLLNDYPTEEWQQFCGQAKEMLDAGDYRCLTRGKGLAITLEPLAVCRQNLKQTLSWYSDKKSAHALLLSLLWGLIGAGEEWLQTRGLPHLVLPMIDKFFISSQRDQDLEYLPLFVELACIHGLAPFFLLIDYTSRAENPSLQLAIERWRRHYPFLGLGVFASDNDYIESSLETILACSSRTSLFALRPMTQVHNPIPFDTLLLQKPNNFLTPEQYDSSWKDNLPFLYHGTHVAPLAGRMILMDQFPPVLITSAGPVAFGAYYRCRLRKLALKRLDIAKTENIVGSHNTSSLDSLWWEYASLANLL